MSREIGPWKLIVNCLYVAQEPVPFNDFFWEYLSKASEKIRENFPRVRIYDDHYSIESAINHTPLFIDIDINNNTLGIDKNKCQRDCLNEIINYSFDQDLRESLPNLIKTVWEEHIQSLS